MTQESYTLTIIDTLNVRTIVKFKTGKYRNLMELIVNNMYEEIGDCKGRAWCGTCRVEVTKITINDVLSKDEINKLSELSDGKLNSRLSCQIMLDEKIHNGVFKISSIE